MKKDALGTRIKLYEAVSNYNLLPNSPLFIRVDGKAFHTFARDACKPFDHHLIDSMVYATRLTAKEMQGFKLAYTQSDEATFMLTDYDTFETQGWFNYELNKVVSIAASAFTAHFNHYYHGTDNHPMQTQAMFDARAFNVPQEDAPNVFVWRQKDWMRNSVQMLARSLYSHKELERKNNLELLEMIKSKGSVWDELSNQLKYGTFVTPDNECVYSQFDYSTLKSYLDTQA